MNVSVLHVPRARWRGVAAVGALLLVLVAGCSSGETSSGAPSSAPTTTRPPDTTAPPRLTGRYVALGSSFAAGPLIPDADPDGGTCVRSRRNYPNLVAEELGLDLVDVSCSGATVGHLTSPQDGNAPQADAVTEETALVTITIGGNDLGYVDAALTCMRAAETGEGCAVPGRVAAETSARAMASELTTTIEVLQARAPDAEVLLVTYPALFPDTDAACPPDNVIGEADSAALADVGRILDEAFSTVAADTGVTLVDIFTPSLEHTVCAPSADRWVHGSGPVVDAFSYHPNAAGMAAMADAVVAALVDPRR